MSTSTVVPAIDLNDPAFFIPQQIYIPGPLTSPFAKRLDELGEDKMARRAEDCGRFCKKRCSEGHLDIFRQRCAGAFCPDCGPRMLEETCERWELAIKEIMEASDVVDGVYLEFRIPAQRDRKVANDLLNSIPSGDDSHFGVHWKRLVGYQNDRVIIKALCVDPHLCTQHTKPANWALLAGFPAGTITTAEHVHKFQLWWFFENKLMAPFVLKECEDPAGQQALFKGMHRFRASGVELTKAPEIKPLSSDTPETEDFFTMDENSLVNKSDESPSDDVTVVESKTPRQTLCSTCGRPHIQQTQWFVKDSHNPGPQECRWHDLS
jgi:hypothetical protein